MAVTLIALAVFLVFIAQTAFPAFRYAAPSRTLIDVSKPIGPEVSAFMWEYRSIDLLAQVFVLFGAAAGCLAMLRAGGKKEEAG